MQTLAREWSKLRGFEELKTNESSIELAHYTSLIAIVSMLQDESGGLRLSDTSTMNDPNEGLATEVDRELLSLLSREFGKDSWLYQRYSNANVCCFVGKASENLREITLGDHLLYWRLYGNDCRGASISLPTHLVEKLLKQSIIDRVIYSDEQPDYEPKISSLLKLLQDIDELRSEAIKEGTWPKICGNILPDTDRFFKQRFLHKRSDFNMEREYRAITFISNDNAEDYVNMKRGQHVQFGLIRNYLQIVDLNCQSIFTSGTKITVGNNVRNSREAKEYIAETLRKQGTDYLGVSVSVSQIEYRPH